MALTAAQTLDMLADLASGAIDDVFSQVELDRLYTRAGEDYNLAVYYGWRQIAGSSASWVDYQVAQTKVSKSQAAANILKMLELWANESRSVANQVRIVGANGIPPRDKDEPLLNDSVAFGRSRYYPRRRY